MVPKVILGPYQSTLCDNLACCPCYPGVKCEKRPCPEVSIFSYNVEYACAQVKFFNGIFLKIENKVILEGFNHQKKQKKK